ncbi:MULTISPECIES: hypothetical protein [unclassified Fusobacterium]|uniref:hypothetical protein n=1 Tax=unclassified Fusobacterium TaxID=2648384 RepID=UPI001B8B0D0E|nr:MULTISPECIES: hypothetical protein [unclassified Fusobacterium]
MKIKNDLIEKEKDFDNSVRSESSKSYEFLFYFSSLTLFDNKSFYFNLVHKRNLTNKYFFFNNYLPSFGLQ